MTAAPLPANEEERIQTLLSYEILDTVAEQCFDDICRIAASVCRTPVSLVTLLDRRRQWFKAHIGWDVQETDRDCSFCAHAILTQDITVVHDAYQDPRFMDNALVLSAPNIRFYAGVPLRAHNGLPLGTLCVIDKVSRTLGPEDRNALIALARQVEAQLELRRLNLELHRSQAARAKLARFLIHDLNNPLTAISLAVGALSWHTQEQGQLSQLGSDVEDLTESIHYMRRLVLNFQDIAAAESAALVARPGIVSLPTLVSALTQRQRATAQSNQVQLLSDIDPAAETFSTDPELLDRILDNLVYNALSFAPRGSTVLINARRRDSTILLGVSDEGPGVAAADSERIFDLYAQASERLRPGTRGLGLAFCKAAAQVLGGGIRYESREPRGSTFVVELPDRV